MAVVHVDRTAHVPRVVLVDGEHRSELPALWLRERSPEPDQLDAITQQRLFDPHLLDVDLAIDDAAIDGDTLEVVFSDGHRARYHVRVLAQHATLTAWLPAPVPWRAGTDRPRVHDWSDVRSDGTAEVAALHDFLVDGAVVLDGVPTAPGSIFDVAERFGFVRETNFGRLFDVRSAPNSTDLASRAVALSAHTDNPYRSPVPGIQLLHCLVNDTSGGLSTLVDGLAAVEQLRLDDPDSVTLLATVGVRFRYRDADTDIVTVRPVIDTDHDGRVTGLSYSPRLDETPLLPVDEMRRYQAARQHLSRLLSSGDFETRFKLDAGQLMMFDNNRVLHGRTAFDPNEGPRHLQGCYIDHDGPRTRYRVLSARARRHDPVPAPAAGATP
jgi:gamma-butyrobetaine dioxygenase